MGIKIKRVKNPTPILNIKVLKRMETAITRMDGKLSMLEIEADYISRSIDSGAHTNEEIRKAIVGIERGAKGFYVQLKILKEDSKKYQGEIDFLFKKSKKQGTTNYVVDQDRQELITVEIPKFMHDNFEDYINDEASFKKWLVHVKVQMKNRSN